MSEELAAETPDAAIRAYLFAIGFTLVLVGGDMMAEKVDPRFYTGLALVIIALPVHLAWVFWKKLKPHLNTYVLSEATLIASSLRWWLGVLLILLAAAVLSPFFEDQRWPFSAWFPPSPTLDQTATAVSDKLARRLSLPKPDDFADAIIHKMPTTAAATDIADAIAGRLPKQLPVQMPSASDIAREIVRQSPQIVDNQGQNVQELTKALSASNKMREELTQQLDALRSTGLTKSAVLGLDDAKRWQLFKSIQAVSVDDKGQKIQCRAVESIDTQSKTAMDLFGEFDEVIYYGWNDRQQGFPPPPHQPFGITFLVGNHSGNAFTCATHTVGVLQNILQIPVYLKTDQVSDNLEKCNNECVEVRFGGER
jgi:hypothetical protein